jgi:nucleoside-diphosphate-sugar epimerase
MSGFDDRSVLVVGAQGVLGAAVVRAFEDARWRVVRGVRRCGGVGGSVLVDLDRPETVAAAIAGVDLVVDAARARGPMTSHKPDRRRNL